MTEASPMSFPRVRSLFVAVALALLTLPSASAHPTSLTPPATSVAPLTVIALTHDLGRIRTFEARFSERVSNPALRSHVHHKGRVWIERPNRFSWIYETPNREIITADGRALWIYDVTLEQVTVRPLTPSLGATPAMLLAGTRPLTQLFRIVVAQRPGTLQRAWLTPRSAHSEFRKIEVELRRGVPVVMTLWDRLGEKTQIQFTHIRINQPIRPGRFHFVPPHGVAVIGHP